MYQRVRRYAVPQWMIDAATERRLAGDVACACAAANLDLDVNLAAVALVCGQETADVVADDLRHLARDLLRWHMFRVLEPAGATSPASAVLRQYPAGGGAILVVRRSPRSRRCRGYRGPPYGRRRSRRCGRGPRAATPGP
jgi:hypothetical protein